MSNTQFQSDIDTLAKHYGNHSKVARALGYSVSGWKKARRSLNAKAANVARLKVQAMGLGGGDEAGGQ